MQSTIPHSILEKALTHEIQNQRQDHLLAVSQALKEWYLEHGSLRLIFVCTHNSRRSQMAEVLAVLAASQYNIEIETFSAGTETTQAHENTIVALEHFGLTFHAEKEYDQVVYSTQLHQQGKKLYSKTLEDEQLPKKDFFAIMTCDHAAENCPFVPGASERFLLTYDDPKKSDGTSQSGEVYLQTAITIFSELLFVFAQMQSYGGEKQA